MGEQKTVGHSSLPLKISDVQHPGSEQHALSVLSKGLSCRSLGWAGLRPPGMMEDWNPVTSSQPGRRVYPWGRGLGPACVSVGSDACTPPRPAPHVSSVCPSPTSIGYRGASLPRTPPSPAPLDVSVAISVTSRHISLREEVSQMVIAELSQKKNSFQRRIYIKCGISHFWVGRTYIYQS